MQYILLLLDSPSILGRSLVFILLAFATLKLRSFQLVYAVEPSFHFFLSNYISRPPITTSCSHQYFTCRQHEGHIQIRMEDTYCILKTVVSNLLPWPTTYIVNIYGNYILYSVDQLVPVVALGVANEHLKHDRSKTKTNDMLIGERPLYFCNRNVLHLVLVVQLRYSVVLSILSSLFGLSCM